MKDEKFSLHQTFKIFVCKTTVQRTSFTVFPSILINSDANAFLAKSNFSDNTRSASFAFSYMLHTYTDVHGLANQSGLGGIRVLGSVTKRAAQHASHLNVRLIGVMLNSKQTQNYV